ncbi:MAG: acetate--CoA ligase family protein [candidate division Zixibacteria bacterium]|nr:acetate--CoA ligase family protein [candidate division Zixibacteria bacterium]
MSEARNPLDYIFRPRSVAVVGASPKKGTIGRELLHNIIEGGFNGSVFPVNPNYPVIHSIKCYSKVGEIPDAVDLAIIIVPRDFVMGVVDDCGKKGVRGLVVITAGFKEAGPKGVELEKQLKEKVVGYGMRMIGPNCFGVVNTNPDIRLYATFGKTQPLAGKIGFISQSGAMGESMLYHAQQIGLGISQFASIGNKADVSGNDLLEYWREDSQTEVILMYLENFGNPLKFTKIARELSRKKPMIVVKSGRTLAGSRAAVSHTGSLAGLDIGVDALLEQAGVLRVSSVEEMFDLATAFSLQTVPAGSKVAIVTNAGGPGIITTDAVVQMGLSLAKFSDATKEAIRTAVPEAANLENPVDLIATADAKAYGAALAAVMADPAVDSVIVLFVPPINIDQMAVAQSILEVHSRFKKPIYTSLMGVSENSPPVSLLRDNSIPAYAFPESIVKSLAGLERYRVWSARPESVFPKFKVNRKAAGELLEKAKTCGGKILGLEALELLGAYGIPVVPSKMAGNPDELLEAAVKIGFPLVLKINDPKLVHKTEIGGVIADLRTKEEVLDAYSKLQKSYEKALPGGKFTGVLVQRMIKGGVETVFGITLDRSYGPLMMFGLGGVFVEVIKDVSFRLHPLSKTDAGEMVRSVKAFPLLSGFRGSKPVQIDKLEEVLLRLSQLVGDFPEILELDINPFFATPEAENCAAVDCRIVVSV